MSLLDVIEWFHEDGTPQSKVYNEWIIEDKPRKEATLLKQMQKLWVEHKRTLV